MKTKLPRTHKMLEELLSREYIRGWADAEASGRRKAEELNNSIKVKQPATRLEALRAATSLASALGQSIGELSRAMRSEAGQL